MNRFDGSGSFVDRSELSVVFVLLYSGSCQGSYLRLTPVGDCARMRG